MAERKGLKLRRCSKQAGHYKAQFAITEKSLNKKLGAYIRSFPEDIQAVAIYNARNHTGGQGHIVNCTPKAKRRLWVNHNTMPHAWAVDNHITD